MGEASFTDLQADYAVRARGDSYCSDIAALIEDKADIASDVAKALGPLNAGVSGRVGACILVRMPVASDDFSDVGGERTPLDSDWTFTVVENPTVNRDTANGGTGKRALSIARRLHRIFKNYIAGGLAQNLVPLKPCIVPSDEFSPLPAYDCRFTTREADPTVYQKVPTPTISPAGGLYTVPRLVTLFCPVGPQLYYTLDGSHPNAQNPNAVAYIDPFNVVVPGTLRVACSVAGYVESDVIAAVFS